MEAGSNESPAVAGVQAERPRIKITFKRPPLPVQLTPDFQHQAEAIREELHPTASGEKSPPHHHRSKTTAPRKRRASRPKRVEEADDFEEEELAHKSSASQAVDSEAGKPQTGIMAFRNYQTKFQWRQVSIRIPTAITGAQMQAVVWRRFPLA